MPSRSNQRVTHLAPLEEVYAFIDAVARPVEPREVAVSQASGRVLAADAVVAAPAPARALALRDGWAVASERVADAGPYAPAPLAPPPAWVECGEALPGGADAVLAPDAVALTDGVAEALAAASAGDHVLTVGLDADPRVPLCKAGARLRPTDLAAMQAVGIERVWTRVPRARVVSTAPDRRGASDFVGGLIARAVEGEGGAAILEAGADASALARLLAEDGCDVILTVGGTGMGRRDASVSTLAQVGHLAMHGIGVRPGDSAALGTVESRPVLQLPGRLDAALSAWLVVGRRLLARLAARGAAEDGVPVRLARKVVSTIGLAEVVPVGYCEGGVEPLASEYFPLRSLTCAAGWILVPPESEGFPLGAMVALQPFP